MRKLLFLILLLPTLSFARLYDKIIAVVNGEPITLSEVGAVSLLEKMENGDMKAMETLMKRVDEAIEYALISQEAEKLHITVNDKEVEEAIERIMERRGITQEELKKALEAEGITYEIYKKMVKARLLKARILATLIKPKVMIREKDLMEFYREHISMYSTKPERKVYQIFTTSRENIEKAYKELLKGKSFRDVAIEYGDLGSYDLGLVGRGELIKPLDEAIFSTPVGKFSRPFKTKFGYHIVFVVKEIPGRPIPFEKVKNKVKNDYYTWAVKKEYEEWLDKLKRSSVIEIKL